MARSRVIASREERMSSLCPRGHLGLVGWNLHGFHAQFLHSINLHNYVQLNHCDKESLSPAQNDEFVGRERPQTLYVSA